MERYDLSEMMRYTDPETGAHVTRLTGQRCNSNHLYFTNNCFYANNTKIVFMSDRNNAQNLFSLDLQSGEIIQLTDLPKLPYGRDYPLLHSFVDGLHDFCCYNTNDSLYVLDLNTGVSRKIYTYPEGFCSHIISISCDGQYAYTSIYQAAMRPASSMHNQSNALQFITESKPLSRIIRIPTAGGDCEILREDHHFNAHVNTSPADPNYITFCHEGNWSKVDHRLWVMDVRTREAWKVHECQPGETIGHEYWYADGKRIGYHGHLSDGSKQLGHVRIDNTEDEAFSFPFNTGHIFSQDERLIVGDGSQEGQFIRIWTLDENGYSQPRALCRHASSFKNQCTHVHPRITPDGKAVLYTSDVSGYNQLYLVELPEDLNALPLLSTLSQY